MANSKWISLYQFCGNKEYGTILLSFAVYNQLLRKLNFEDKKNKEIPKLNNVMKRYLRKRNQI